MMIRPIFGGLALAALMVAAAAILKYAEHAGFIGPDFATRATQIAAGLVLAVYANFIPKNLPSPQKSAEAAARMQSARRVGGWAFVVAGFAYAAVWAMASLGAAADISMAVIVGPMVVALGYGFWACRARSGDNPVAQ